MKLVEMIMMLFALTLSIHADNENFIQTKMGSVAIESPSEYEHWLNFNGKRIQKFEDRYVSLKEHYEGANKVIIVLNLDNGTSLVKPEYAIIEIINGNITVSNRVIAYDYTFKVIKATNKKLIIDVGLSDNGSKRTATYENGKITVHEERPKFNAIDNTQTIEAQKQAIHAHLNSFFRSENRLEGDMGIEAADGNIVVYKKDNFDVRYAEVTLYNDGTTSIQKYYFKDNKPFYVEESITYSAEFAALAGVPASQNDIKKYYFFNGKMARYEDNSGRVETSNLAHREEYIMNIANAIIQRNTCDS
ncbi:MAG: hypothetical protein JXQ76_00855 [Campylobacterales bacterium]|nr:hypothetical protein [Campylobacterales bacterium]